MFFFCIFKDVGELAGHLQLFLNGINWTDRLFTGTRLRGTLEEEREPSDSWIVFVVVITDRCTEHAIAARISNLHIR